MHRRIALLALAAALAAPTIAVAAAVPKPDAAEAKFVATIRTELTKAFATPSAAERAGYVRYTNEDETGAISYANPHYWNSTGPSQPSQLWYDVRGHLLGADYSVLKNDSPNAPSRFGIARSRFHEVGAHIHYVVKNADGSFSYSKAVGVKRYAATGLDAQHPTAAGLVRLGVVSSPAQVATVFLLPATWDVSVWVLPNPAGAFADANPLIKPSKSAEERPM